VKRLWRYAVLDAVEHLGRSSQDGIVTRRALLEIALSTIVAETRSKGRTPDKTLNRELQELRDDRLIEFVSRGRYRLTKSLVIADSFGGTDAELDHLIRENRFRIPELPTGEDLVLARRRRGRDRLRAHTLANYSLCCALCDCRDESLLVASHIVPWAESESARGDLHNILALCEPHDSLFEHGYWSLDKRYGVLRSPRAELWVTRVLLPPEIRFRAQSEFRPDEAYVESHRQRHGLS